MSYSVVFGWSLSCSKIKNIISSFVRQIMLLLYARWGWFYPYRDWFLVSISFKSWLLPARTSHIPLELLLDCSNCSFSSGNFTKSDTLHAYEYMWLSWYLNILDCWHVYPACDASRVKNWVSFYEMRRIFGEYIVRKWLVCWYDW